MQCVCKLSHLGDMSEPLTKKNQHFGEEPGVKLNKKNLRNDFHPGGATR